jgi:hypothetical protein
MNFNPFERFNPENPDENWYWAELRRQRDKLLMACDWTVLADSPLNQDAWKSYRQELRDLPNLVSDPLDAVFPSKPE